MTYTQIGIKILLRDINEKGITMIKIRQGRSQSCVAEKLGITKSAYSNIETLKTKPSYKILVKLENLLAFLMGTCSNKSLMKTF